jgi:hypothetical protein
MIKEQFFDILTRLSKHSDEPFENGIHDIMVLNIDSLKNNSKPSYFSDREHPKLNYHEIGLDNIDILRHEKTDHEEYIMFHFKYQNEYYFIMTIEDNNWNRTEAIKAKSVETILEIFAKIIPHCPEFENHKEYIVQTQIKIEKTQLEQLINQNIAINHKTFKI